MPDTLHQVARLPRASGELGFFPARAHSVSIRAMPALPLRLRPGARARPRDSRGCPRPREGAPARSRGQVTPARESRVRHAAAMVSGVRGVGIADEAIVPPRLDAENVVLAWCVRSCSSPCSTGTLLAHGKVQHSRPVAALPCAASPHRRAARRGGRPRLVVALLLLHPLRLLRHPAHPRRDRSGGGTPAGAPALHRRPGPPGLGPPPPPRPA